MDIPNTASLTGQILRGYELRAVLGVGGFGIVYQAYQQIIERDVAIKVILPQHANQPDFIRRFESEARIVAHLEHPFIVPLYDFWREPDGAYLVMRWLRGGSLRGLLSQRPVLSITTISQFLEQIGDALSAGHRKGIIHQDIKPENILLDEYENAYLTDFGIARKRYELEAPEPEKEGFGTAAYASPEQILRQPITVQTDVYSLGMMVYELLTGTVPFDAPSESTIIHKQLHEPVPVIRRDGIPYEVNQVIWRATAKKPADRYPDTLTLVADFQRAIESAEPGSGRLIRVEPAKTQITPAMPARTRILFAPETVNPYKGLQPFSEADVEDFFGREELVEKLIGRFDSSKSRSRFLAIIGPSGSGKSSIVQAGVIPGLRRGAIRGSEQWFTTQMTPGAAPFTELEAALVKISPKPLDELPSQLRDPDSGLSRILEQILPGTNTNCVLVIDQFEELFTLCEDEAERALFLDCLLNALQKPAGRLRIIITLRADFYDRPLMYAGFGNLLKDNTEVVLPLSLEGLEQAIIRPAERQGVHLEEGLLSDIIDDVHLQPSALPLLQHALSELYSHRDGQLLTRKAYQSIGGVVGALARRAEDIFKDLDPAHQLAARQIFLHLVAAGEGLTDTSRRVHRETLMVADIDKRIMSEVLDAFGKYRLLTFDHDPATRAPTVQIAHEALIRSWERLRDWINSNREDLRLRQSLAAATQEWRDAGRDPSFLAAGSRLSQFETLLENAALILHEDERQYLEASIALRRRAANRLRMVMVGLAAFSLVALALALFALDRQAQAVTARELADQEAQISRSRELAMLALTNQDQLDLSLLLSVEALRSANTFEARNSLLTSLQASPHLVAFLHGHQDGVRTVQFSPDGRLLASGGRDNAIYLWDVETKSLAAPAITGNSGWINSLSFSPDGRVLASTSEDGTVRMWDVTSGQPIGEPLRGHAGAVRSVTFSPDGRFLASAGADNLVLLWDAASGEPVGRPLAGHSDVVWSVAFSPDSTQLATASADRTIRLWDVETQATIGQPFVGHNNWVLSVAFSPDGRMLASGGADQAIIIWDVESHSLIGQPNLLHQNWVRRVAFSPDGQYLLSASADQTVRLWNLQNLPEIINEQVYRGHGDAVWSVAFHPNGHRFATAGADQKVILWDTNPVQSHASYLSNSGEPVMSLALDSSGERLASAGGSRTESATISLWDMQTRSQSGTLQESDTLVTSIAFDPVGRSLVSASVEGSIHLWDLETGVLKNTFLLPSPSPVYSVSLSLDGKLLAAATDSLIVPLWNVETGDLLGELSGHTDGLLSVAFSPDGRLLASGGRDMTIRLWDVASQQAVGTPLIGHSDAVMNLAFSLDGRLLASGSRDGTIQLWDLASGQAYGEALRGHTNWITSVAFSQDSQLLVSGSQDRTVRLWDVVTGQPLGSPFLEHTNWVNSVVFNRDGNVVLSGGQDGAIILRDIAPPSLQNLACVIANRNLTDAEWQQYFRDRPFRDTCIENNSAGID